MGVCCSKTGDQSRGGGNLDTKTNRTRAGTLAPNIKNFKNLKHIDNIDDLYTVTKKLGEGSFGTVNAAVRKSTGGVHAIKSILK